MDNNKSKSNKLVSINGQMNRLIIIIIVPLLLLIALLVTTLVSINKRYTQTMQNANIAADFNVEFKDTIDLEMWNHVIMPRGVESDAALPMNELDNAVDVLHRLAVTTTLRDNAWRINSMLNMCENLRGYMLEIAETESYDERMDLLDRNVRGETGLTVLIESYMHDYIDDEVREMARLQEVIETQVTTIIIATVIVAVLMVFITLVYSIHFSRRITVPIAGLAQKVEQLGDGDFNIIPIETSSSEIQTLDSGFNKMVERIDNLMAKQIEDQRYLHRAELELLQAQINPHFLYNTLDSIVILAESERNEDVINMVTSLSVFFRNSLNRGSDIITLAAEKDQVTSYLEIQQIRYSDRLKYKIDIPDEFLDYRIPKLVLQPIVENAIYHGTKSKRRVGSILITAKEANGDILIKVSDDGIGMEPDQLAALQAGIYENHHNGLGLVNVHRRIKLYCGDKYGLSFESESGKGTTVSILLSKEVNYEFERRRDNEEI